MCGILGILDRSAHNLSAACVEMTNSLQHRGPDDSGVWCDQDIGLAFGFRRLAILDLTQEGHQPMSSHSGRYIIVYNGEIYNHSELRSQLELLGHSFRGRSDTEVILQAFEHWGIEATLAKLVGMFACAIWDKQTRSLSLLRDRLGEKPLYYGWSAGTFGFCSDLIALTRKPNFKTEINRDAVALLMQFSYIPAPHSIYRNVFKLPPGTILTLSLDALHSKPQDFSPFSDQSRAVAPRTYWSVKKSIQQSTRTRLNDQDALAGLEAVLLRSVSGQMIADVPVGAFLSGGIDSSTVVALMQHLNHGNVRTYSVGFEEESYNEAAYASKIANHIGTQHTEMFVTANDALNLIPHLPSIYSEPFADPSQIPTTLLSRLTRQHITVALSGDGADELFGGYSRYLAAAKIWRGLSLLPSRVRGLLKPLSRLVPDVFLNLVYRLSRPNSYFDEPASRIRRLLNHMAANGRGELYLGLLSFWEKTNKLVLGSDIAPTVLGDSLHDFEQLDYLEWLMYADTINYLPDDILTKVDRASMSASLETRAPFLDHRVVEYVWGLSLNQRIRGDTTKWLLRKLLYKYVPENLVDRPKMGFGVPIAQWLRGPLRSWAEELLEPSGLKRAGYFEANLIRQRWQAHLSGKANYEYALWNVLMFQQWLAAQSN